MNSPVVVTIVGAPIACKEGVKDTWREVAEWAAGQLATRYGHAVRVEYFDLFDPDCPSLPQDAELPVVFINQKVFSCGGKVSIPAIRKHLEASGLNIKEK